MDTRQIFLGNSQLTLQPTGTRLVDMNGDGIEDRVVTYAAGPTQRLMTLPLALDDPITLYYRTYKGDGYEVAGRFGIGDELATPSMRAGRGPGRYTVSWDGPNDSGRPLTGGMFFVRFTAGRCGRTIKTAMMP